MEPHNGVLILQSPTLSLSLLHDAITTLYAPDDPSPALIAEA